MIAIRTCSEDFHYMLRMKDGTWTHKPGQTHVLQLKKKPWNYKKWHVEAYISKINGSELMISLIIVRLNI